VELVDKLANDVTESTLEEFKRICVEFVLPKCRSEINISSKERQPLVDAHEELVKGGIWNESITPKRMFSDARGICVADLMVNFQDWKGTIDAHTIISKLSNNSSVISRNPVYVVLDKIKNSFYAQDFNTTEENMVFAQNLALPTYLREHYLSFDWKQTEKLEKRVRSSMKLDPFKVMRSC
jgi:hypothetical protein